MDSLAIETQRVALSLLLLSFGVRCYCLLIPSYFLIFQRVSPSSSRSFPFASLCLVSSLVALLFFFISFSLSISFLFYISVSASDQLLLLYLLSV